MIRPLHDLFLGVKYFFPLHTVLNLHNFMKKIILYCVEGKIHLLIMRVSCLYL